MSCPVALIGPSVTPISVDHKAREHRRPGEVPRWVHAKRLDRNRNGIRNRTWPPSYLRCSAMQTIRALRAAALLVRIRLAPRRLSAGGHPAHRPRHLPQQLRTPKASSLDATPGTELPAISSTPVSR